MKDNKNIKVCLVGSSGGHLTHLYMLKPFWKDKDHFWVTFDKEDARSLLKGEKMYPCYYPTNRSLKALIKNTKIAWDVLHKEKPDLIIIDGGKGQLSSVMHIVEEMGIKVGKGGIDFVSLAKREEEVFLPNQSDSILLPRDSNALYLIQRIRDEAHRFAITFHRDLRSKKLKNGK